MTGWPTNIVCGAGDQRHLVGGWSRYLPTVIPYPMVDLYMYVGPVMDDWFTLDICQGHVLDDRPTDFLWWMVDLPILWWTPGPPTSCDIWLTYRSQVMDEWPTSFCDEWLTYRRHCDEWQTYSDGWLTYRCSVLDDWPTDLMWWMNDLPTSTDLPISCYEWLAYLFLVIDDFPTDVLCWIIDLHVLTSCAGQLTYRRPVRDGWPPSLPGRALTLVPGTLAPRI